jgi:hypothetical protein
MAANSSASGPASSSLPSSSRIDRRRGVFAHRDAVTTKRWCRPRLPGDEVVPAQATQTVSGKRPAGRLRCDASAGAQHVAGDGQFVGRGAGVGAGVVQDEVLEMDQLAIDPKRGAGIGEMRAFNPAGADRRAGDPLIDGQTAADMSRANS